MLNSAELYRGAPQPGITGAPVDAIEFYNAAQNHYFMTWIPNEIAILDAGVQLLGWQRTGNAFLTYRPRSAERSYSHSPWWGVVLLDVIRQRGGSVMDRRTFIGRVAVGLLAVPFAAEAQQAARLPRIGVLFAGNVGVGTEVRAPLSSLDQGACCCFGLFGK